MSIDLTAFSLIARSSSRISVASSTASPIALELSLSLSTSELAFSIIPPIEITLENDEPVLFKVDMGTSTFKTPEIPMASDMDEFLDSPLEVLDTTFNTTAISVGNPHAIIFVDNIDEIDIDKYGPAIETHEVFPEKINVHFVEVISKNEGKMLTWERGAGVTLACGTGATSTAISGFKLGLFDSEVLLHLPGGDLKFNVYEKKEELGAFMEGPAQLVFDGEIQ